ncbi:hypothetical protein C0993_000161 [Termitomyces sp. T159_Od127]|nr:hypothetical protein C0993_000161 [Termitomyces sp. T159_Od127]
MAGRSMQGKFKSTMDFADWIIEVTELDKELAEDRAQTQAIIDASNAERVAKRKPLIERISEPFSHTNSTSPASGTTTPRLKLSRLMDDGRGYSPNIKAVHAAAHFIAITRKPRMPAQ